MTRALTLTLTAALIVSSLPAQAQPRYTYAPNVSDWSFVAAIAPGTKVAVSAVGLGGQDGQYFLSATEREVTLLTLANADLPRPAKNFVVKLAETHPEMFMSPQRWVEYHEGSARVTPAGVFVRGRKVADLSDITKTIKAGDVAEVARQVREHRRPHNFGASPAEGIAALVPLVGLTFLGCHNECGRAAVAVAVIGGPIIVAEIIAARKVDNTTEIVYRAR
jgi:hypothetical protein